MEAAAGKLAASGLMEEDGLSQVSELTGMELSGLLRASVGDLAACSSDDDNNSCGGGAGSGAVAAMCASYASSLASEAAKSGPATPEPGRFLLLPLYMTCESTMIHKSDRKYVVA